MPDPDSPSTKAPDARERVLESAYTLFSRQGVRAVGVDSVVTHAGVARMSLYRNFASKDALALEFLSLREERFGRAWIEREVLARAETPSDRLLAIFDLFDEWFAEDGFVGCPILNIMLETPDAASPIRRATLDAMARVRAFLVGLAEAAGVERPDAFAAQWHILMKGSIVAAAEGDLQAARNARDVGELLLRAHLADRA